MNGNAGSRRDNFFSRIPFAVSFSPANLSVCTLQLLWMFTIVGAVFSPSQDVKIHVKELDPLNLTCNLSGSNITWNYRGKISFGCVRRLESIMRRASGVYRCNNSTCVENYTVIVECGAEGTIPANVTRVNLGETLNIHCEVDATPQETNVPCFFKVNNSNLTISNVSCSLEGIYICSPVNNISYAENGTTSVNVIQVRDQNLSNRQGYTCTHQIEYICTL
ncbi:cell adhesion [Porites harrisoni]